MNVFSFDLLLALAETPFRSQRELAGRSGLSLGLVNRSLQELKDEGLLDDVFSLTDQARLLLAASQPRQAVILAAGYGMRMVPVSGTPKALLEVRGERLVERLIRQLNEVGITDIAVVVGYRKELFEYLIDMYGVSLVYNPDYAEKNNLFSLSLVTNRLENCYILPCDLWCGKNPFRTDELFSWYLVSEEKDPSSDVRVSRKRELVRVSPSAPGNRMIGIAYLCGKSGEEVSRRVLALSRESRNRTAFWESALYDDDRMFVHARVFPPGDAVEINTYEQLRELDAASGSLQVEALQCIAGVFGVSQDEIREISVLKKGMTNRSFLFTVRGEQYIMRIPGEGTDRLISREHEADVYAAILGKGLCDDPVFLDPKSGYKITRYLPGARVCDDRREEDLARCMKKLRSFHGMKLQVEHGFDLFGQILFYESLWPDGQPVYRDYEQTKAAVFALKPWLDTQEKEICLTHIDAVRDNFLFCTLPSEKEESLQLVDWEYAGMQDPHVDLAMFAVYAFYSRAELDHLIDLYFENHCPDAVRVKIYAYVAICGLLWSNWCEYKSSLGIEFGEYSLRQYRYAKDFCRLVQQERGRLHE